MALLRLDLPHHVTAGTVGPPGQRSFHLQFEDEDHRVTLLAEKQQVASLGEMLARILTRFELTSATDWDRDAMALRAPVDAVWRVASGEVGALVEQRRVELHLVGLDVGDEVPFDEVALSMDLDQARRLTAHIDELVDQGRPRCHLCGRPVEPDARGHVCPATNGHGRLTV